MGVAVIATVKTPVGLLRLEADDEGLVRIEFGVRQLAAALKAAAKPPHSKTLDLAVEQLTQFFAGKRKTFDVKLALRGTPFQLDVWRELLRIPYGETRSYAQIAKSIGRPAAIRAVGAANGANPIPIIIPCHRVIGSNGALTGFGGGIDVKRWLLDFERNLRLPT